MAPTSGIPSNNLRVNWYRWLLPELIRQDQAAPGALTPLDFYDNPTGEFTAYDQPGGQYDRLAYKPVIQTMFAVFETATGEDLQLLEGLSDLVDVDKAPAQYLPLMADSLGRKMPDSLSEAEQREFVRSIIAVNKSRGTVISWTIFFRQLGHAINIHPLWKKDVREAQRRYSQTQYPDPTSTTEVSLSVVTGNILEGTLANKFIVPGTLIISNVNEVFKDNGEGVLRSVLGNTGTIDYISGKFYLTFSAAIGTASASYDYAADFYPYVAARVDLDVYVVPLYGGDTPTVDSAYLTHLLETVEEVRPIHILVRNFSLLMDINDELLDAATDAVCCGPSMALDRVYPRPGWLPFEPTMQENFYVADKAPGVGDNNSRITRSDTSPAVIEVDEGMDDLTGFTNPLLDVLKITTTDLSLIVTVLGYY